MPALTLYVAPGTCARVPTIVLEEAGVPFETRVVRFMQGEHKSAGYRQFNPKGKVPALVIDGEPLTENVAIILYLHEILPDAGVLPRVEGSLARARQLADLCFCSSTLHPLVTRIRMPQFFAMPEAAHSVRERGCEAMKEYFALIEDRLASLPWWYGEALSAMDAYLYWVFWRVAGAGFDVQAYPRYADHARRMEQRAAVARALAREAGWQRQLEAEGLAFTPPPVPAG